MASFLLRPLHLLEAALSVYALLPSSIAIRNLQEYEPRTKRAARLSNTAEEQLWKTRYTQGTGLISILISLTTSFSLVFKSETTQTTVLLYAVNAASTLGVRAYMRDFWATSARVPGVETYNEAVRRTDRVMACLGFMGVGWILLGGIGVIEVVRT